MKLSYDTICALAHGIDYTEQENGNFIFSRFSKQERECLSCGKDNSFSTSGVRLEFETDCTYLKISVCNEHSNTHGRNFYSYDIYCNDNMIGQIKNYNVEPSYPYKNYSLNDRHKIFKFSVGIKKICVYIHFINGFYFIPHNKKYYRDGYLHPNDKGFEFYAKELAEYFKKISIIN